MQTSPSECLERLQTRINHEGGLSPKISVEVVNRYAPCLSIICIHLTPRLIVQLLSKPFTSIIRQLQQDAYELPSRIEGFCKLYPCYSTLACAKEVIEGIKTLIQKSSVNSEFPKEMRLRENQQQEYHNAFSSLEIKVADHSGAAKSYKLNGELVICCVNQRFKNVSNAKFLKLKPTSKNETKYCQEESCISQKQII